MDNRLRLQLEETEIQYRDLELRYRLARTGEERLSALEDMATVQQHLRKLLEQSTAEIKRRQRSDSETTTS